jgi:hypothetical protein
MGKPRLSSWLTAVLFLVGLLFWVLVAYGAILVIRNSKLGLDGGFFIVAVAASVSLAVSSLRSNRSGKERGVPSDRMIGLVAGAGGFVLAVVFREITAGIWQPDGTDLGLFFLVGGHCLLGAVQRWRRKVARAPSVATAGSEG